VKAFATKPVLYIVSPATSLARETPDAVMFETPAPEVARTNPAVWLLEISVVTTPHRVINAIGPVTVKRPISAVVLSRFIVAIVVIVFTSYRNEEAIIYMILTVEVGVRGLQII
jgi:hypothetical protein